MRNAVSFATLNYAMQLLDNIDAINMRSTKSQLVDRRSIVLLMTVHLLRHWPIYLPPLLFFADGSSGPPVDVFADANFSNNNNNKNINLTAMPLVLTSRQLLPLTNGGD